MSAANKQGQHTMPASQHQLADKYHTTSSPDNRISLGGKHTVVGLDLETEDMPSGRFIWFHVDDPKNEGGVLRGTNVAGWRATTKQELRRAAIEKAMYYGNLSEAQATRQVGRVIQAGGMLL